MVYTVYIDVLFILDFIIDYLILYAVGKIGGAVIFRLRLLLSAGLGAAVSLLRFFTMRCIPCRLWCFVRTLWWESPTSFADGSTYLFF